KLVLELPGRPAGIAEGHQDLLRPLASADRLEDVLGRGEADMVLHAQGGLPAARRRMQHETAVGLYRAAEISRRAGVFAVVQRELQALEQGLQRHVDGTVDDQAERALIVVLADVRE